MSELRPCAGCQRHVREGACPFCGDDAARPTAGGHLRGRHGRAARLFLGAAIVASAATGCGSTTVPDDAGVDAGDIVTPYGTPAPLDTLV